MQQVIIGLLLDDGGRLVGRMVSSLAVVVVVALFVVVVAPVALLAQALGAGGSAAAPAAATAPSAAGAHSYSVSTLAVGAGEAAPSSAAGGSAPPATNPAPVEIARRYLGVPYVFGGSNPATGLDCSGLVQLVFRQLQIALPRTAQQQYDTTARVAQDELQPGDLVFFAHTYADPHDWVTHVGIYIGGGMQINAPTEGQVVSIQPVFTGYWGAHFAGGGRVRAA